MCDCFHSRSHFWGGGKRATVNAYRTADLENTDHLLDCKPVPKDGIVGSRLHQYTVGMEVYGCANTNPSLGSKMCSLILSGCNPSQFRIAQLTHHPIPVVA